MGAWLNNSWRLKIVSFCDGLSTDGGRKLIIFFLIDGDGSGYFFVEDLVLLFLKKNYFSFRSTWNWLV